MQQKRDEIQIKSALISVYHKDGLDGIIAKLHDLNIRIISTGGTKNHIEKLGFPVTAVEDLTGYPSILGGRVKTLHPKIFGGILCRRELPADNEDLLKYDIPEIDLVVVDLYPFEETVAAGASEDDIIEKIDIGGISLIRAAAKNWKDILIIPSRQQYPDLMDILEKQKGVSTLTQRKRLSTEAFHISSDYDTGIFSYMNTPRQMDAFKKSIIPAKSLRYGENPHQQGTFYGNFDALFEQLHGKEVSYNNLLDIEAAVYLIDEFRDTTFAILKHNNACGIASRNELSEAWKLALAGDPVSAFGGILITNRTVDHITAAEIDLLFFEVIIAPDYDPEALKILQKKKNRIILLRKNVVLPTVQFRSLLNGVVEQDRDIRMESKEDMKPVTKRLPSEDDYNDIIFANKVVKHSKSNTIVLARDRQLLASGVGQTSRVDALKQAIEKAINFGFKLEGAVMASDAFFPFPDCVEIADGAGIGLVVQPGGSVRDKESVDYCDLHDMAMVFTGVRHFKH